jgi:hypothetical protein
MLLLCFPFPLLHTERNQTLQALRHIVLRCWFTEWGGWRFLASLAQQAHHFEKARVGE